MKIRGMLFVFVFFIVLTNVSGIIFVNDCTNLNTSNEKYFLQNDIILPTNNCFNITGNNITFDMGYSFLADATNKTIFSLDGVDGFKLLNGIISSGRIELDNTKNTEISNNFFFQKTYLYSINSTNLKIKNNKRHLFAEIKNSLNLIIEENIYLADGGLIIENVENVFILNNEFKYQKTNLTFKNLNNLTFSQNLLIEQLYPSFEKISNSNIKGNFIDNSQIGFLINFMEDTIFEENEIKNSVQVGIHIKNSGVNNYFVNNLFNNSQNVYFEDTQKVNLNSTKEYKKNVVETFSYGGNYWGNPNCTGFSDLCSDLDFDSFCDSEKIIDQLNIDYLPLTTVHFGEYDLINYTFVENDSIYDLSSYLLEANTETSSNCKYNLSIKNQTDVILIEENFLSTQDNLYHEYLVDSLRNTSPDEKYIFELYCYNGYGHSINKSIFYVEINYSKINLMGFNGDTTNFSEVNFSNIINLTFERHPYGKIIFLNPVNLSSGLDLSGNIKINQNQIYVNLTAFPELNSEALLYFYNIDFDYEIQKDGNSCEESMCKIISHVNSTLVVEVKEMGNFTISNYIPVETPKKSSGGSSSRSRSRSSDNDFSKIITRLNSTESENISEEKETKYFPLLVEEDEVSQNEPEKNSWGFIYILTGTSMAIASITVREKIVRRKRKKQYDLYGFEISPTLIQKIGKRFLKNNF